MANSETGWLIEQRPHPEHILWVALCYERVTRDTWCTERHGDAPVIFVKDAGHALRFARRGDAEAFVKVFDRFLLNPTVTEHSWPEAPEIYQSSRERTTLETQREVSNRTQLDELRAALRPFAAAAHLLTSAVHNGGIENVREFPTGEEWRVALSVFPEFQGAVRKSPAELRKALGGTND